jgi:hypothetical protein
MVSECVQANTASGAAGGHDLPLGYSHVIMDQHPSYNKEYCQLAQAVAAQGLTGSSEGIVKKLTERLNDR